MRKSEFSLSNRRGWTNIFRQDGYFKLFVMIELILFVCFAVYNLIRHGEPLKSVLTNVAPLGQFCDYFMHVGFASAPLGTNIYAFSSIYVCFPPLAYLMYGLLARWGGTSH